MARNSWIFNTENYEYDPQTPALLSRLAFKSSQSRTGQRNSATKRVARTKSAELVTYQVCRLLSLQRSGYRNWPRQKSKRLRFQAPSQFIRLPHESSIGRGLVISCAILVLMERWHRSMYFEARVIRCWIRQRLQRYSTGDSSPEKRKPLIYQ